MRIPPGPNGHALLSPNQLRTYGAGGFALEGTELPRGCPRKYHHKYELKDFTEETSYPLMYGRVFHRALELMEAEGLDPDTALSQAWDPLLGTDAYQEALDDMRRYLDRPSTPLDRYGTLLTESELSALLYVDEEFGPVYIRGIIDRVAVDFDTPNVLHVVDFKTNRHPPSIDDLRRDVQGKTYSWLVKQNWQKLGLKQEPTVVFHLDAVKWRELPPIRYTETDYETWHAWTVAIARRILRDDTHEPILNEGCAHCPVRDSCPAYNSLPDLASGLMKAKPATPTARFGGVVPWTVEEWERQKEEWSLEVETYQRELMEWRDEANAMRLLLQKAVAEVDSRFVEDAKLLGGISAGDYRWEIVTKWGQVVDLRRLYELLGDQFWDAVTTSKTRLEELTRDWPPGKRQQVLECIRSEPNGSRVEKVRNT